MENKWMERTEGERGGVCRKGARALTSLSLSLSVSLLTGATLSMPKLRASQSMSGAGAL
jgi:hypothetical protein